MAPAPRRSVRMRAGQRRLRLQTRFLRLVSLNGYPALRHSFPRRSRDHGRYSREADQDQNRRGEAAEILQESRMMIPDCQRRLEAAYTDLLQLLESEKDLGEAEEYKEARLVLDSVKLEA
ncbi:tubulin-specific chaperone A isoform X1 [Pseudorca crassidens]|uniref:tubulin-specific chaperone A isoform X1 n=1 Tax=Pseudorca crassidens TaxID=82174 RepID=UPI00352F5460